MGTNPNDTAPPPTSLQSHNNLTNDSMVDFGKSDYSAWDAATLYNVVIKNIDPSGGQSGYGVTQAAQDWIQLADTLGKVHDMLGTYLKPLTGGGSGWTGDAHTAFKDASDRVVKYTKSLAETARFGAASFAPSLYPGAGSTEYASLYSVSTHLGDWMSAIQGALHGSPLNNQGRDYGNAYPPNGNPDTYNVTGDADWLPWAQAHGKGVRVQIAMMYAASSNSSTTTGSSSGYPANMPTSNPTAPQATYDLDAAQAEVYQLPAGYYVVNQSDLVDAIHANRVGYLNFEQQKLYATFANWTAQEYKYYYHYIPEPPKPDMSGVSTSTTSPYDYNGGGGVPPGTPVPPMPNSPLTTSPSGQPTLTGLNNPGGTGLNTGIPGLNSGSGLTNGDSGPFVPTPTTGTDLAGLPTGGMPGDSGLFTPGAGSGLGLGPFGGGGVGGLGDPGGIGSAGALGPGALAAENAAAASAAGRGGMPMYPPMMGGAGAGGGERERTPAGFLVEDDDFWRVNPDVPPPVIGANPAG